MRRWYWLIPLLLAVIVYAPAPWGEMVWDDQLVLEKQLVAFKTIGDAFFPPDGIFQWSSNYYRPVVVLSYMVDVLLYRDARVAGLHISNVFYHAVTTLFVWLLARRLLRHLPGGATGAIMAAAIFAVHPIHTESVSWITGRGDVLAAMFFVPSVSLALIWRDTGAKWSLALGTALYFLALLSKEVAVAALIIVPAALLLTPRLGDSLWAADSTAIRDDSAMPPPAASGFRASIVMWLATAVMLLAATALYLVLRHTDGVAYGIPRDLTWLEYGVRLERSIAYYLVKVLVPWPQSSHVAWDLTPGVVATNVAFLIAVGLVGLSFWFLRRHRDGSLLLMMTWFGATLAPSVMVALRHISGTPLAERYLYLPSVAPALLLGFACCQPYVGRWLKPVTWAVALLVIAYFVTTVERGIVWTSNQSLWADATRKAPSHGEPWNMLGIAYMEQRDYDKALDAFRQAIEGVNHAAGRSFAMRNIAIIYHRQNDLRRARQYYSRALDEMADNPEAHYGLAVILMTEAQNMRGGGDRQTRIDAKVDLAGTRFASTLRLNPFHTDARWGLAAVLSRQGERYENEGDLQMAVARYRSALAEIDTLIAQDPTYLSRMDVRNMRVRLNAALKQTAE